VNINMLRDADNDPGFYAAVCGQNDNWRGAALFQSVDGGASYQGVETFSREATIGTLTTTLGNFTGGNTVDETNRFTVSLTHGELSSTTYEGLLAGTLSAVVGREILSFRTATLNGDGTYTVSGLLRGRRGSEYAIATHTAGERFVLISPAAFRRIPADTASIGSNRLYKAVTAGTTVESAAAVSFTNEAAGLKPYACVRLGGGRSAAGDIELAWTRRSRISGEWRDGVDVPISEQAEAYEVDIWSSATRTTLTRTLAGLGSPAATYTAAQQVSDFGSLRAILYFSVYQVSAVVGRGFVAHGTV
jgi:hypothetical protein